MWFLAATRTRRSSAELAYARRKLFPGVESASGITILGQLACDLARPLDAHAKPTVNISYIGPVGLC